MVPEENDVKLARLAMAWVMSKINNDDDENSDDDYAADVDDYNDDDDDHNQIKPAINHRPVMMRAMMS